MAAVEKRVSRPRRYAYPPAAGFANEVAAHLVAALDELTTRHFHMIGPLPADVLAWTPAEGWYSITRITAHMIQGEAQWLTKVVEPDLPTDLAEPLASWRAGEPAAAADLEAVAWRMRREVTGAGIAPLTDIDAETAVGEHVVTPRGLLMHMAWHWTYHNGQCALIAGQRGHEYRWTFAPRIAGAP